MSLYVPGAEPALKSPRRYGSKPITAQSYEGHTTVTGTPSPDNPATLTPVEVPAVPGAAKQVGPLWSLPDGTRDTYDGETGELVRKIYKIVLNGTENWSASKLETGVYDFKLEGYPFVVGQMDNAIGTNVLSSHFIIAQGLLLYKSSYGQKTEIHLYFTEITTVDGIKAWLSAQAAAGTPVTVLYELAQPTVDHLIYTGPIATRATDILAPSWTGKTTMIGEPSPDNPATISGVPFQATATGPDGQTRSVDLGFTGYSLPDGTRDTYDGGRGDFVQRVGKLVLDGTENWLTVSVSEILTIYYIRLYSAKTKHNMISSHFVYNKSNDVCHSFHIDKFNALIFNYENGVGGVDNFKSWLSAQAAAGTPVTVYYAIAEPIAYNRKADITAFDGQTTVTGADTVEVIEGRVLRVADCLPFEIVRSNRNLLDNWYFRRPINQRGITKYTSGYSIDRFIVQNTSEECSLTLENDCVLLKAKNNDGLIQPFEQTMFNAGDVMTCSALLKDGTFLSRAFTITPEVKIYPYDSVWNVAFGQIAGGIWYVWPIITYDRPDPVEARIIAVKLELGTQQTLARKIGDQWVLNDPPPDYGLELLKCQRYYCDLMFNIWVPKCRDVDNLHQISVRYPVTMRAAPTIKILNESGAVDTNMNVSVAHISSAVISLNNEGIIYRIIADANL